jgi:hypothetical protein
MANEQNGWVSFVLTAGPAFDIIGATAGDAVLDDSIDTSSNSNGDENGGVRSMEPGHFIKYGQTTIKVKHSSETRISSIAQIGIKDSGVLTRKSGATTNATGWIVSYTEDESSPASAPEATVLWENYTGAKGETPPVDTPAS